MRVAVFSIVLLGLFALAACQLNAGNAWEGTWSNGKRSSLGGNLFICVDPTTNTAHGTYGNGGLISGRLSGNTFKGFWYEAGYDSPFGPFDLTISGNSFSGSWSYQNVQDGNFTNSFTWSGSKSSSVEPTLQQCLTPVTAGNVNGAYEEGVGMCYYPEVTYQNTNQQYVTANVPGGFGAVQGYTFDSGASVALSDFYFPDDDDDGLYPESAGQDTQFGPGGDFDDDGDDDSGDDDDDINTRRILVGRLVQQDLFCGFLWEGLYNTFVGSGCYERTSPNQPDGFSCGSNIIYVNGNPDVFDFIDGNTQYIVDLVQDALDELTLPDFIIPGDNTWWDVFDDEDEDDVTYVEDDEGNVDIVTADDDNDSASTMTVAFTVVLAAFFLVFF